MHCASNAIIYIILSILYEKNIAAKICNSNFDEKIFSSNLIKILFLTISRTQCIFYLCISNILVSNMKVIRVAFIISCQKHS